MFVKSTQMSPPLFQKMRTHPSLSRCGLPSFDKGASTRRAHINECRIYMHFFAKIQLHISPFPFPSPSMKGVNIFEHKIFVDVYYRTKLPHVSFFCFFCFLDVPHRQSLKGGRDRSMYCTSTFIELLCFTRPFFFWRDRGVQSYASVTQRGRRISLIPASPGKFYGGARRPFMMSHSRGSNRKSTQKHFSFLQRCIDNCYSNFNSPLTFKVLLEAWRGAHGAAFVQYLRSGFTLTTVTVCLN